jgi:hypothetical protein
MNTIKRFRQFILIILLSIGLKTYANDSLKIDLSLSADLVNHFVWRGLMLSNSPSVQPTMGIRYGGFSFGSWASYSVNPSAFQEVDLYITYSIGSLTFGVNDYYNPVDSMGFGDNYFNFDKRKTLHAVEPFLTISNIFKTKFSATAGFFAYGNDRDENFKNLYSSYFELSYSTKVNDYGLNFFSGATFNNGFYSDKPAVVNLGVTINKEIKVTETFNIPCRGSFIINPDTQNVYFVLGVTF